MEEDIELVELGRLQGGGRKEKVGKTESGNKKEQLYKIVILGDTCTGKSCLIKRFVHQEFKHLIRRTIGVDFALKVLQWDNDTIVRLQLWDISDFGRFNDMTRIYYKGAVGCLIIFDVTRPLTLDIAKKIKMDLDSKVQLSDGSPVPCVLLANLVDRVEKICILNDSEMDVLCRENGFIGWFKTSAKDNINIDESFMFLVKRIIADARKLYKQDRTRKCIVV